MADSNGATHHENNPSLSGLSEIGISSAPNLGGQERGSLDSQSQKRSIVGTSLAPNASMPMSASLANPSTSINN